MPPNIFNALGSVGQAVVAFFAFFTAGGIMRIIVLIFIVIVVLTYFGFDIQTFIESAAFQNNIGYVWEWVMVAWNFFVGVWNTYLEAPAYYFWNNVFVGLLWESFVDNLTRIKEGKPHDFQLNAPYVPVDYQTQ